ncbi:hypothetical protein ACFV42_36730 [Streptomyces solisilvae]|uniref:hypothetical protein n=1 Tax=Streptomyces malaysiensis TaxID=92644 RepID=UPI0036D0CB7A
MRGDSWLMRLSSRWVGRPRADWIIALVVVGLHAITFAVTGSGDVLGWPGREQRITIYTTTATVAALVGSFVTAAIAQYAASTGRRMHELRTNRRLGPQFRRNWVSVLSATLTISGLCLLATVLDTTERDPGGAHWLAETAVMIGAVRSTRLVWLFNKVIEVGDEDLADNRPAAPGAGTPLSATPPRTRTLPPGA